jgi:hypothetical protein
MVPLAKELADFRAIPAAWRVQTDTREGAN